MVNTMVLPISYQTLQPFVLDEPVNDPGRAIAAPLVSWPAVFPYKSANNDFATITGRVLKVANMTWPTSSLELYATEFVNLVIPDSMAGIGIPLDIDEVKLIQNSPAQRMRTAQVENRLTPSLVDNRLKAFIKSEAYADFNDPRNITTCDASLTVLMSCFTYAMKRSVLSNYSWYGPGATCTELASRLADVCAMGAIITDYSRFDGTISHFLQVHVVKRIYMRYFHLAHSVELQREFALVFKKRATTNCGFRYDAGWGTRSGSPITTDANTIINAFVCYAAARQNNISIRVAWDNLGLYYGDDGVHRNLLGLQPSLIDVARKLGLTIEIGAIRRGQPVAFLGRVFVDPLTTYDSFQDPRRFMPKLHYTTNLDIDEKQALYNKAIGYIVTDANTPILGVWARRMAELSGLTIPYRLSRDELYRIDQAWPQDDPDAIAEAFAQVMDWTLSELKIKDLEISAAKHPYDYPVVWDNVRQTKIDVVFGGSLIRAPRQCESQEIWIHQAKLKMPLTQPNLPKPISKITSFAPIPVTDQEMSREAPVKKNRQTRRKWKRPTNSGASEPQPQSARSSTIPTEGTGGTPTPEPQRPGPSQTNRSSRP